MFKHKTTCPNIPTNISHWNAVKHTWTNVDLSSLGPVAFRWKQLHSECTRHAIIPWNEFENCTSKINATSPRANELNTFAYHCQLYWLPGHQLPILKHWNLTTLEYMTRYYFAYYPCYTFLSWSLVRVHILFFIQQHFIQLRLIKLHCGFNHCRECFYFSGGLHVSGQIWPKWRSPNVPMINYVSGIYGYLYFHQIYVTWYGICICFCWINFVWVCVWVWVIIGLWIKSLTHALVMLIR